MQRLPLVGAQTVTKGTASSFCIITSAVFRIRLTNMDNRRMRLILAYVLGGFAAAFSLTAFILVHEGGLSAPDGWGLAIGGIFFGFAVGTSIVKPLEFGFIRQGFLSFLQVLSWAVAISGGIAFVIVWARFFASPDRSSAKEAWKSGAVALGILFALTPMALNFDDWRTRLEAANEARLVQNQEANSEPNHVAQDNRQAERDRRDQDFAPRDGGDSPLAP